MNELRRMAYLDALGVDGYISRAQLPGAAPTHRLVVVPAQQEAAPPAGVDVPVPDGVPARPAVPQREVESSSSAQIPQIDSASPPVEPGPVTGEVQRQEPVPRFSLVAMVAGDWLWLEEMGDMPLGRDQVQLVQAMANALAVVGGAGGQAPTDAANPGAARPGAARPGPAQPAVSHFRWPIHTNQQLDLGEEAARASVAGFVGRRLEQQQCRGLVLLGRACAARVPLQHLGVSSVVTHSSAEILASPSLKLQVWRDLLPLASPA